MACVYHNDHCCSENGVYLWQQLQLILHEYVNILAKLQMQSISETSHFNVNYDTLIYILILVSSATIGKNVGQMYAYPEVVVIVLPNCI